MPWGRMIRLSLAAGFGAQLAEAVGRYLGTRAGEPEFLILDVALLFALGYCVGYGDRDVADPSHSATDDTKG